MSATGCSKCDGHGWRTVGADYADRVLKLPAHRWREMTQAERDGWREATAAQRAALAEAVYPCRDCAADAFFAWLDRGKGNGDNEPLPTPPSDTWDDRADIR